MDAPVVIPIHFSVNSGDDDTDNEKEPSSPREWAMVEINGELVVPPEPATEGVSDIVAADRFELGSIRFDGPDHTPIMILGSHELVGKMESLKQPFCVLRKVQGRDHSCSKDQVSYNVQGVVTRKIVFNKYPKVILRSNAT